MSDKFNPSDPHAMLTTILDNGGEATVWGTGLGEVYVSLVESETDDLVEVQLNREEALVFLKNLAISLAPMCLLRVGVTWS